ncbi:hypothetical protein OF83DRAFT_1081793 [Amylostereum chailletii]|nr:hypothetical protein OF83DRAFT_1081793 [Amylostereum chailletii]
MKEKKRGYQHLQKMNKHQHEVPPKDGCVEFGRQRHSLDEGSLSRCEMEKREGPRRPGAQIFRQAGAAVDVKPSVLIRIDASRTHIQSMPRDDGLDCTWYDAPQCDVKMVGWRVPPSRKNTSRGIHASAAWPVLSQFPFALPDFIANDVLLVLSVSIVVYRCQVFPCFNPDPASKNKNSSTTLGMIVVPFVAKDSDLRDPTDVVRIQGEL